MSSGYYSSPITIKGATIAKIGQITVHTGDMTDGLHNIVTCPAGVNYIKFDVKSTNTSMSAGSTKTSLQLYYNNTLMATLLTVENNTSLWFTNVYLIEFDSVYDNIIRVGYDKDKIALVAIPRLPTDAETVSFRVNVGTYGNGNFAGNLRHF